MDVAEVWRKECEQQMSRIKELEKENMLLKEAVRQYRTVNEELTKALNNQD